MTERRLMMVMAVGLVAGLTLMPVAAGAAQQTAEPAVLGLGWWWEEANSEEVDIQGNKVVVGTTNPYCPGAGNGLGSVTPACAEGVLPIEIIGGDYDTPNKMSALSFDLSYLTPGSEVFKFEVKLLEAEKGCYDGPDEGTECTPGQPGAEGDHVEQTDPVNIEGHTVQACIVPEIFGDAEGAPYIEAPRYECSSSDPIGERKEIDAVDELDADGLDHVWTFDLTEYARGWAEEFTVATNVMLVGAVPEETGQQDSWRVIFAGPKAEKGIKTKLVYEPAEIALPPTVPPPAGSDTSDFGGSTTTTGGDFGSGTTDFGSGTPAGGSTTDTGDPAASPSPAPGGQTLAGDALDDTGGLPGYVWLALLAGIVGFVLVRQVVVEATAGIRPDGVLAKIHALNAERKGIIEHVAGVDTPTGLGAAFSAIGSKVSAAVGKLPFGRKG
jgi:hypothetical protein